MKKISIITLIAVVGLNVTGCATAPLNTNCVTTSGKKVANPNYMPNTGTAVGAGIVAGGGAIIGGSIGFSTGFVAGLAAGGPFSIIFPLMPLALGVFGAGVGAGIGAIAGAAVGGSIGYTYDYKHAKSGAFQYSITCGDPYGKKVYAVSNNKLIIESNPDNFEVIATQTDYKLIESGVPVNLFTNSEGYYIERQTRTKESENK